MFFLFFLCLNLLYWIFLLNDLLIIFLFILFNVMVSVGFINCIEFLGVFFIGVFGFFGVFGWFGDLGWVLLLIKLFFFLCVLIVVSIWLMLLILNFLFFLCIMGGFFVEGFFGGLFIKFVMVFESFGGFIVSVFL